MYVNMSLANARDSLGVRDSESLRSRSRSTSRRYGCRTALWIARVSGGRVRRPHGQPGPVVCGWAGPAVRLHVLKQGGQDRESFVVRGLAHHQSLKDPEDGHEEVLLKDGRRRLGDVGAQ